MNTAAAPQQRRRAVRPRAARDTSGRAVLGQHLLALTERMARESARLHDGEPGAVHRMRVHSRRFRSALRTFAPVMRTEELADARADLVWVADTLAPLRDLEVVQQRLLRPTGSRPGGHDAATAAAEQGVAWVVPRLRREREEAWGEVLEVLEGDRWAQVVPRLQAIAADPPTRGRADRPADAVVPALVSRQFEALRTRASALRRDSDSATWHRVRITAKHARNAAELAVPVVGQDARRLAKRLNTLTDLLGELQDTTLVRTTLERSAHDSGGREEGPDVALVSAGFGLGLLHAQEGDTAARLRAAFPAAWDEASRKRYRRWLGV